MIINRSKKTIKIAILIVLSLICILCFNACKNNVDSSGDNSTATINDGLANESPFGFVRLQGAYKNIQFGKDYVYFNGTECGVFKYDYKTGDVSNICTDPLCKHFGTGASCRIANVRKSALGFFRVFSDTMIYNAQLQNRDLGKKTLHMFAYNMEHMTNTLLEDDAGTTNQYCISEQYVYFTNVTVKEEKSYYNFKQVNLFTGENIIFGEESLGKTEYKLIGAYNGKLFATNPEETVTYVCSEENPGEFQKIWDRRMSFIFTDGTELYFASKDVNNMQSDTYYFYNTDLKGNVISKHELKGGMSFGSILDGRNLYYVPKETVIITIPDGTEKETHQRYIYKLDTETGETSVAFEFNGDYSMLWFLNTANDFMVYDNKIYTYKLGGVVCPEGGVEGVDFDYFLLEDGVVIIDIETGDINYVTANYDANEGFQFAWNIETISMDIDSENLK